MDKILKLSTMDSTCFKHLFRPNHKIKGIMVLVMTLLLTMPAFMTLVHADTDNVIDQAEIFSDAEENEMQSIIDRIKSEYGMEPVVVAVPSTEGKTSMAYADDYFDYNGYGVGDSNDGILMLITFENNIGNREVWFSTTGTIIDQYQPLIDPVYEKVAPILSDGDYGEAGVKFLELVENIERTGKVTTFSQRVVGMMTSIIPYAVALVLAFLATAGLTYSSKSKITTTGRSYESDESFKLTKQVDQFVNEHVTRRAIPKKSSGGGGGGSHTGSSGTSHGGGGGGF